MTVPSGWDDPWHAPGQEPAPVAGDVPALRPPWLDDLGLLVGEWETYAQWPGDPPGTSRGLATFEWLDGGFYVLQRFCADNPLLPGGVAIIGAAADGAFTQRYYDSRGVHRVYSMALNGGVWRLWRDAPWFWQRYTATVGAGGATITGAWELSRDGLTWTHDFHLSYRRIS
jgi:hypothetical protein